MISPKSLPHLASATLLAAGALALMPTASHAQSAEEANLYSWRGPNQNGDIPEVYTNAKGIEEEPAWTHELSGRGTPVIVDGRLLQYGYRGVTEDLRETLTVLDAKTGKLIWEKKFADFLSDTIYNRYGLGSATVDAETKDIYLMTSPGMFFCFDWDGNEKWHVSMMEDFGRLTFPNGRVGAPVIEGNLVIIQGITANWGAEGPPRNRYYAFDKASGKLVWSSTPGVQPVDSSWSTPYVETRDGKRIFYAGTGCGNIVAVNALNGKSYWRFQASKGGVNCSPVVHGDKLIYIHGVENLDTTETGRMVAIKIPSSGLKPTPPGQENAPLPADAEVWRLPVSSFSSSPVLVGDRVYQLTETGSVLAVDANTGKLMWEEKLAPANVHSSVTAAGGLLFCPVENGNFYVLKDGGDKAEKLSHVELEGNCLGAPAVWGGHVFVETTKHLYAFKIKADKVEYHAPKAAEMPKAGPAAALQAVPGEAILAPGGSQEFAVHKVDANGNVLGEASGVSWAKFVPPTAKVKAEMDAAFDGGKLAAGADAKMSAGAFKATADGLSGTIRGRVLPKLPYTEDFESYENDENPSPDGGATFAYPPLPWIGARFKWEIREIDGTKALTKTLDRLILQRAMTFIADTESSDYTVQADIMTDGNRRVKSDVGLINQRYIIALKGNANKLEVFSNYERFRHDVSFKVEANKWYTMKTAVEAKGDGSGVIRAKVWERGTDEPEAWTIEVPHDTVHQKGAPGIYGFSPQSQKRVYVDNIKVTPNK